jgi:hypothetical protein
VAESLGNLKSLVSLVREDPSDETKLKLRSAIRSIVREVWLLVIPADRSVAFPTRIAAVRIEFRKDRDPLEGEPADHKHRDYLVIHTPLRNLSGSVEVRTFAVRANLAYDLDKPDAVAYSDVSDDLRSPGFVAQLEPVLARLVNTTVDALLDGDEIPHPVRLWLGSLSAPKTIPVS